MSTDREVESQRFVIGEFEFLPTTGELIAVGDSTLVKRLPPQPAKLLSLLIDRPGEIVTQQEICQEVWGDVGVDLTQNLHFCVRQARSALGDSASSPQYIETIPRRGYRLIADCVDASVDPVVDVETDSKKVTPGNRTSNVLPWIIATAGLIVLTASVAQWAMGPNTARDSQLSALATEPAKRVAVMSFKPDSDLRWNLENSRIGELLVVGLFADGNSDLDIIGPTTTEAFSSSAEDLRTMIQQYSLDFVINGRFVQRDGRVGLLAELIRATDGAHVWVQLFDETETAEAIVQSVLTNVSSHFESANFKSNP